MDTLIDIPMIATEESLPIIHVISLVINHVISPDELGSIADSNIALMTKCLRLVVLRVVSRKLNYKVLKMK